MMNGSSAHAVACARPMCDSGPMHEGSGEDEATGADRRTAALAGLAIVLALAIAALLLVRELRKESALEDCLMSGRSNCAPIEAPPRP
jgi:hypothetical protein